MTLLGWLAAATQVWGGTGRETTVSDFDVAMTVDSRWAGAAYGGYYPLRIRVVNRGETRALKFRFSSDLEGSRSMPVAERTLKAEQNATLQFTLAVPMVSAGSRGQLQVFQDGRELEGLTTSLSLADSGAGDSGRTSLLVISHNNVDFTAFETAANLLGGNTGPGGTRFVPTKHRVFGTSATIRADDHMQIPPVLLPESWIDYSGVDIVAIPLETLAKLATAARDALLKWSECGGTLIVYDVKQPPGASPELARLLEFERFANSEATWKAADLSLRRPLSTAQVPGNPLAEQRAATPNGEGPLEGDYYLWPASGDTFLRRSRMLGTVVAFPGDPFRGSPSDWNWLLESIGRNRWLWTARIGFSSRQPSVEFIKFLIPGVGGVPVYAFLALITLFALVIGPLNYLILWHKRRLYLLVLTIPAIALTTTCSLFGYATVAEGFGVKSRVLSYTLLDQSAKSATSLARVSLYAGMAPSTGMKFSADTAAFPVWPAQEHFESGRLDWSNSFQQLTSGWLRSRTRTQFLTLAHRVERGRLEIQPAATGADTLQIANGFPWKIRAVLLAAPSGELYMGREMVAGGSQELKKTPPREAQRRLSQLLNENPLQAPDGLDGDKQNSFMNFRRQNPMDMLEDDPLQSFGASQLQSGLDALRRIDQPLTELPPRTYVIVFGENPAIEVGVPGSSELASLHVLVGRY